MAEDLMGNGTKNCSIYEIKNGQEIDYNNRKVDKQTSIEIHHRSLDFL